MRRHNRDETSEGFTAPAGPVAKESISTEEVAAGYAERPAGETADQELAQRVRDTQSRLQYVESQRDRLEEEIRALRAGVTRQEEDDAATPRRVNVQFSAEAYQALRELAKEEDKSISEVLRDALKLEKFFHDLKQQKARILIERDGKVRELLRV